MASRAHAMGGRMTKLQDVSRTQKFRALADATARAATDAAPLEREKLLEASSTLSSLARSSERRIKGNDDAVKLLPSNATKAEVTSSRRRQATRHGVEVPSARINWYKTASYLGWLSLDKSEGGLGMANEVAETMGWLAVPDHIEQYVEWHRKRVGALNRGVRQFFGFIGSIVRPEVGYLRQRPELLKTLPEKYWSYDWETLCQRQFELLDQLMQSYKDEIVASRGSMEPLKHILQAPQPMDAMADMIQRIRADRPVGQPRREAFWARDLVLLRMLISNPLRFRMLASLTWRADNTGELYQRSDKSWWIRISRTKFKNVKGAAGDGDYDSQVHASAWRDIERYLFNFRPKLLREPTDLVFLAMPSHGVTEHRPWEGLSRHVAKLTARYLVRCVGIRAHAFRHIVATSILKANGGDYKTAALVLNDRPVTVERHYAWLRSNDGSERMAELLDSSFKRM